MQETGSNTVAMYVFHIVQIISADPKVVEVSVYLQRLICMG
jgi:hypothetical protein